MNAALNSIKGHKLRAASAFLSRVSTWFVLNGVAFVGLIVVHFALGLSTIKWWPDVFSIATNLLAGGLVSFLFYYLVVYLPTERKKRIIKANMLKMYADIKRDILYEIVWASIEGGRRDLDPSSDLIERLQSTASFKEAFEGGKESDEGFYAFENQMSSETPQFIEIVRNLTILSRQIEFVLHNYSIDDQEVFDFFKRLELILMNIRANGAGYDSSKSLCSFLWEVYAGWSNVVGEIGYDLIQKMISGL